MTTTLAQQHGKEAELWSSVVELWRGCQMVGGRYSLKVVPDLTKGCHFTCTVSRKLVLFLLLPLQG